MESKKDTMKTLAQRAKKKKVIVIAAVLAVVVAGSAILMSNGSSSAANRMADVPTLETDEVTVRSLVKSVGATGTVISVNSRDISLSLTNIEVEEVLASVGDVVSVGQTLMTFNLEDIESNLESAQSSLSTAQARNSITLQEASRSVSDAQRTESYQIETAQSNLVSSYNDYKKLQDEYNSANDTRESLKTSENNAYNTYQEKKKAVEAALAVLEEKTREMETVSDNDAGASTAKAAYESALANYNTAQAERQAAESTYNAYKSSREQQDSVVSTLATQYTNADLSYKTAQRNYDNTVAGQASSVTGAINSQKSSSLNANTDNEKKQVEQYEEQLEKGILTAPFAGTVTAVNYETGDKYNGGAAITLQDCSVYEIEAEIGEYDISDIKLGQKVLIKTNATGQEELEGEVIFISPTATKSAGLSSDVTYTVKISILTPTERMRLDMSASLSIIIESHENVYTVPYNAVEMDQEGNYLITEVAEDGITTNKIPVTVIMESNYYTEIESQDIYEGQRITVTKEVEESSMDLFQMRGGF